METDKFIQADRFAKLILDMSTLLLSSGAHCGRINRNVQRFADTWHFRIDLFISFTGVSVTVVDMNNPENKATRNRQATTHGVHYGILTEISLLSWKAYEEKMSIDEVEKLLSDIHYTPRHNKWTIRLGIGFACAALCILAGGDWINGSISFVAATTGLIVRQQVMAWKFNAMIAILLSAFVTTMISGMDMLYHIGQSPEKTIATSVLFLIPGVPLINSVIDLFEGYIPTALARGMFGGFVLLCIAVGMSLSISLIGVNNF